MANSSKNSPQLGDDPTKWFDELYSFYRNGNGNGDNEEATESESELENAVDESETPGSVEAMPGDVITDDSQAVIGQLAENYSLPDKPSKPLVQENRRRREYMHRESKTQGFRPWDTLHRVIKSIETNYGMVSHYDPNVEQRLKQQMVSDAVTALKMIPHFQAPSTPIITFYEDFAFYTAACFASGLMDYEDMTNIIEVGLLNGKAPRERNIGTLVLKAMRSAFRVSSGQILTADVSRDEPFYQRIVQLGKYIEQLNGNSS